MSAFRALERARQATTQAPNVNAPTVALFARLLRFDPLIPEEAISLPAPDNERARTRRAVSGPSCVLRQDLVDTVGQHFCT